MNDFSNLFFREARTEDGRYLWDMVEQIGTLEQNSSYCYVLMTKLFSKTCTVVEQNGERVGFLMGFCPPARPDTLFVWQIGVAPEFRGSGLATGLLLRALSQCQARYVEATVGVSNASSRALFASFARRIGTGCRVDSYFHQDDFPNAHEAEQLFRIGPIDCRCQAYLDTAALYQVGTTRIAAMKGTPE